MRVSFRGVTLTLVVGWLVLFALLPNLLVIGSSLLNRSVESFVAWPPTLEAYRRLFDPIYWEILLHSLKLAAMATVIALLLGYPLAVVMARAGRRWQLWLLLLLILPFWTNSLVRVYAIKSILGTRGLINTTLLDLGLIEQPLNLLYTEFAVVFGLVYVLFPFMVLPLYASLERLDPRLLEAGRDLGANALQRLWRITLPLTLPGIIAGSLMVFLPAMGMFYIADLLGELKICC